MTGAGGFMLRLRVPAAGGVLEAVETAFLALGGAVVRDVAEGRTEIPVQVYLVEPPAPADVAAALAAAGLAPTEVAIEALPAVDWVAESQKDLPAVRAGRFFVHGAHAAAGQPASAVAIRIEAGRAFGTGHHESTRGCLLALDALDALARRGRPGPDGRACLDLGCGSGVLAIAMAKLWGGPVVAADIDPQAVATTRENLRINGVAPWVRVQVCDGAARRPLRRSGPYGVIAANILAGPLAAMAGPLAGVLAPGGWLILSGLLRHQEAAVLAPYRARRLRLVRRVVLGDWSTLVVRG